MHQIRIFPIKYTTENTTAPREAEQGEAFCSHCRLWNKNKHNSGLNNTTAWNEKGALGQQLLVLLIKHEVPEPIFLINIPDQNLRVGSVEGNQGSSADGKGAAPGMPERSSPGRGTSPTRCGFLLRDFVFPSLLQATRADTPPAGGRRIPSSKRCLWNGDGAVVLCWDFWHFSVFHLSLNNQNTESSKSRVCFSDCSRNYSFFH